MNKWMHTNQQVSSLQVVHKLRNSSQLSQNNMQIDSGIQEEVGKELSCLNKDTLMTIIPKGEHEQKEASDISKGVKITPPEYRNILSEWGDLPDFSWLPDIPKLSVKFTIDEITNAPSHIINSSAHKSKNLSQLSSKNKGGQQVNRGDTPKSNERRAKLERNRTDRVNWKEEEASAISSKNSTYILWGSKRKAKAPFLKSNVQTLYGSRKINPFRDVKRRYRKREEISSEDCPPIIPELKLVRRNTERNVLSRKRLENNFGCQLKTPQLLKRSKSMSRLSFTLCPPPPLNTTQYISHSLEINKIKLPSFNGKSPMKSKCIETTTDENTPDTWDSMEGMLNF